MCGRVCIRMYAGRTRGCVRMMRNMYNSCATTSVRMCWDETKKSQTTNHTNRRGRPWKYKVGTVWSVVCAMNLGLFSEKSLKDVSFVSLWDVFVKKRFSKDGLQDLQTSNVLEHKLCDQMNASSRYWPFIHEARSTIALAKSVRNRTKKRRKRVPWTLTRRQTKRNDEAPKLPHRRANDNRKTPVATNFALQTRERSRVVSEGSMTTGSSGYNFSFRQLHSRLPNENGRGTCQPANEREARRATWKGFSEDFGQVDYSGSKYSESRPSVPERTESRGRTNRSERPEYFRNVMRTADKDENEKSTKRKTCKEVSSNGRNESKKKYRILLLAKRRQILEQNRKKRWKGRRTKSTANDKALCVSQKRRNTAVVNTQENVKHTRKNCEFNAQQRSYDFIDASSYKENLRSTATAIMQDIQEQIRNEGSSIDLGNTDDTIYESAVDSPTEKQDDDLNRDISMEYEWVDQDSEFINGNSFQGSEQSIRAMPRVSSMYVNRRKTGKKKSRKTAIDCEFVDRTETTYQNDFHECIDLESSASIPPLKINVDENRGSEDSDVGTIHSTWPRSSLTEGYSNEFDSALPLARKIINDGSTTGSERCYVYRETPDVSPSIQRDESGNDSITDSFALTRSRYRTRNVEDRKQINERDAMKEVITYGKRNKNNDRSLTTDRTSSTGDKNGHSKVQAKSSADSIKSYDSDSNNDNKYSLRRKTRSSIKDTKENSIGKLVWGNCSGWWPALIIDAEQVGMAPESGKTWVYWIGESQISLLNDKTQIEPFSRKLESRLTQQFRKNNTRSHAIDETIKMLRQRYECTLTKPYYYWIRRNIAKMEELDHLNFYPYSDKIQHRLDDLKEQNYKATKQHMLNQRNGSPEPAKKQMVEKAKDTKAWKQMEDERLPLQEQLPGVITWAKIAGHNWWPAMIVDYRDCCLKEPGFGCQWIMWYGDYTVSQVHHLAFLRFHKGITKLREYIENTKKHVYLVGVLQASKSLTKFTINIPTRS